MQGDRTIILLRHSLPEDTEINSVLPDTLAEFDEALARGDLNEPEAALADGAR